MASKTERVKVLVRKLDALNQELETITRHIRRIENKIAGLVGEASGSDDSEDSADAEPSSVSRFSKAGLVLDLIKAEALPDMGPLAIKLYGENSAATRNRARSVLRFLEKKQRMIRRRGDGWEAVPRET